MRRSVVRLLTLMHGMAVGHGNYDRLREMMLQKFNILLVQQPGNSPMFNVLDLNIWQGFQGVVDTLHKTKRHDPDTLSQTVLEALKAFPQQKK